MTVWNSVVPSLRTNQRNILRLVAQHEQRNPHEPCYLGKVTASRRNVFLKAVASLENKQLIDIERTGSNFQAWKVKLLIPVDTVI